LRLLLEIAAADLCFLHHRLLFLNARLPFEAVENRQRYLQAPGVGAEQLRVVLSDYTFVGDKSQRGKALGLDGRETLFRRADALFFGEEVGSIPYRLRDQSSLVRKRTALGCCGERIRQQDVGSERQGKGAQEIEMRVVARVA